MKGSRVPILVVFSLIVVILKLHYEYYHFIFTFVLILLFLFYGVRNKKSKVLNAISIGFIFLNLFVIILPDAFLYKKLFKNWHYWSEEELSLDNFKGKPMMEMDATAAVYPSIIGKFSRAYNYPSSIIFTADNSKNSWIKSYLFTSEDSIVLKNLLKHEKRHLDLTEVFRRKAMDSINKLKFPSVEKKFLVLEYFYNVSDSINDVFDKETEHGVNRLENKKWSNYLDTELGLK